MYGNVNEVIFRNVLFFQQTGFNLIHIDIVLHTHIWEQYHKEDQHRKAYAEFQNSFIHTDFLYSQVEHSMIYRNRETEKDNLYCRFPNIARLKKQFNSDDCDARKQRNSYDCKNFILVIIIIWFFHVNLGLNITLMLNDNRICFFIFGKKYFLLLWAPL